MRLPTMIAIFGLIVAVLGGLWYWQIIQVAVALAASGPSLNRNAWIAVGMVVGGIVTFLVCIVLNVLIRDRED